MLHFPMVAPRPHREHRQNRQRSQPKSLIVDGDPGQKHQHGNRAQCHPQPLHSESWCTGEDSNLRSPLGAADLQSAAINHSATCARLTEPIARSGIANPAIKEPPPSGRRLLLQNPTTAARACHRAIFAPGSCCWVQFSWKAVSPAWLASAATPRGALNTQSWSWRRDLNPRPSDYKSDALPAELRQHATHLGHMPQASIALPARRDKH